MIRLLKGYYVGKATPASGGGTTINNLDVTVNPSVTEQTLTVPEGYTGYGTITANPVTASIDNNIVAGNIKKDVDILGVTGTLQPSETVTATNLTGLSLTAGDKVYLKQQVAQQESVTSLSSGQNWFVLNPAGTKVITNTLIHDIATNTDTSASTNINGMTQQTVLRYEGSKIFVSNYVIEDGAIQTGFTYCQDNYTYNDSNHTLELRDSSLQNVVQSWTVSGNESSGTIYFKDACVVGNALYILQYNYGEYNAVVYKGTIDSQSQSITVSAFDTISVSRSYYSNFTFNKTKFPCNSTLDNKLAICGNFLFDPTKSEAQIGIRIIQLNNSYEYAGEFITNNSDLSGLLATSKGMTYNRGTGVLVMTNPTTTGVFKYNSTTVDFDTIGLVNTSAANYCDTTISNDLSYMSVHQLLITMQVAEGGYNAVPYSMGQDIITGTASENALPDATFNVLVNAYDKLVNKAKYGITIDSIVGDVNANGVLQAPSGSTDLVFTGVKEVATGALSYGFYGGKITSASFPDLLSINNNNSMNYIFSSNPNLTKVLFPELLEINSNNQYMIPSCPLLNEVSFPKLVTIGSNATLSYLCMNSTALEEISFPVLKNILEGYCMSYAFSGTNLSKVYFTSLDNIDGNRVFYGIFHGVQKLANIYFNSLKTTSFGSYVSQFDGMFNSSTAQTSGAFTMHFPSNLESTIQGLTGYPNFGATAGRLTLAFDLPATE